jgi:hypothetical protein
MDVGTLVAAAVALAVAVGGYIQFVLQRSIFPCIEFDAGLLSFDPSGPGRPAVGELVRSMKNVGPGVGYVANVIYRVKYRRADEVALGPDAYLVHAWGTFEYHIDVGRLAWVPTVDRDGPGGEAGGKPARAGRRP